MDANDVIGRGELLRRLDRGRNWLFVRIKSDGFPRDVHGLWCWSWVLDWMEQQRTSQAHDLAGRKL